VLHDLIGPPQVAALLVLAQRGCEELYSMRTTRALLQAGAMEVGSEYYPVVAVAHLAWIASLFFLVPADAAVSRPLLILYLALQAVRYWVIGTLGRYWTHRIITLPRAPIVGRGPYRYISHPNYAVTIAETFLLPVVFGGWALAFIMTAVWSAVINYKIVLENRALAERKGTGEPQPMAPPRGL
jgi:methyltransferase